MTEATVASQNHCNAKYTKSYHVRDNDTVYILFLTQHPEPHTMKRDYDYGMGSSMKHISSKDILSASIEIPQTHAEIVAYIQKNIVRLNTINPVIGGLMELIGEKARGVHGRVEAFTPDEFRYYVISLVLLTIRTIEIAELRVEMSDLSEPAPNPDMLTKELFVKLGIPK